MPNAVQTTAWMLAVAGDVVTNLFGTSVHSKMHLAKAAFTPSIGLQLSDITEADYDGYAAQNITAWGVPHLDASGQIFVSPSTAMDWTPTGSTIPNTIFGWVLVASGGTVIESGLLTAPVTLNGTSTTLQLVPIVPFAPGVAAAVQIP